MNQSQKMYLDLLKTCLTASCYDESAWEAWDLGRSQPVPWSITKPVKSIRSFGRRKFADYLKSKNVALIHRAPFDPSVRRDGRDWPLFAYSMAGHKRLDNVQACVEEVLAGNVPGDFIETGVWQGGMVMLMAAVLKVVGDTERKVWVADSFEGLPVPASDTDGADLSDDEYLKVSLEKVKANFARFDLLSDQVRFLKGWFCDTLPTAPIEKLAILRLDGDLYSSTMDAPKNLYYKVSPGGYVIVDDYGGWDSCKEAITDFLKEHDLKPEIKTIDWTGVYWKVEEPLVKAGRGGMAAGVADG